MHLAGHAASSLTTKRTDVLTTRTNSRKPAPGSQKCQAGAAVQNAKKLAEFSTIHVLFLLQQRNVTQLLPGFCTRSSEAKLVHRLGYFYHDRPPGGNLKTNDECQLCRVGLFGVYVMESELILNYAKWVGARDIYQEVGISVPSQ